MWTGRHCPHSALGERAIRAYAILALYGDGLSLGVDGRRGKSLTRLCERQVSDLNAVPVIGHISALGSVVVDAVARVIDAHLDHLSLPSNKKKSDQCEPSAEHNPTVPADTRTLATYQAVSHAVARGQFHTVPSSSCLRRFNNSTRFKAVTMKTAFSSK